MSDFSQFSKGKKRKEVVGRNANFALLVICEKLDFSAWSILVTFQDLFSVCKKNSKVKYNGGSRLSQRLPTQKDGGTNLLFSQNLPKTARQLKNQSRRGQGRVHNFTTYMYMAEMRRKLVSRVNDRSFTTREIWSEKGYKQ